MRRISSIDIARGLVMVVMALDHTRDLLHADSLTQGPTDLATTTPALFFTRWITHLCAPAFVFLSGTSAYLSLKNRTDGGKGGLFLLTRGIWLLFLEFTLVNFALWSDTHFRILMFQVIAAIGSGFIFLALLYRLPPKVLGIIGLAIIFGHDLLSPALLPAGPAPRFVATLFFSSNFFQLTPNFALLIAYPIIPWLGIMLAGFAAGQLFEKEVAHRKKLFLRIGIGALGLFIVLRLINVYGDPAPWTLQRSGVYSFLSFMNVTKYPPSLQYTLVTLSFLFLFLSFVEGRDSALLRILSIYGKVPLFYYLVHWYILRTIVFLMVFLEGYSFSDLLFGPFQFGRPAKGSGIPLIGVYLVWLSVVTLLFPLCEWYGRYKAGHREKWWLRYL
jgi:uncharacterized membrane protein